MGDVIFYKPSYTETNTHTLSAASGGWTVANTFRINDWSTIHNDFGGYVPGGVMLFNNFLQYRIYGVKLTMTLWPRVTANPGSMPGVTNTAMALVVFIEASPSNTFATDDVGHANKVENMMQGRFRAYKIINYSSMGAKPTKISYYANVNNIFGPDSVVKNDTLFIGGFAGSLPTAPSNGPYMRWGLATLSFTAPPADIVFDNRITIKPYVKCFRRVESVQ